MTVGISLLIIAGLIGFLYIIGTPVEWNSFNRILQSDSIPIRLHHILSSSISWLPVRIGWIIVSNRTIIGYCLNYLWKHDVIEINRWWLFHCNRCQRIAYYYRIILSRTWMILVFFDYWSIGAYYLTAYGLLVSYGVGFSKQIDTVDTETNRWKKFLTRWRNIPNDTKSWIDGQFDFDNRNRQSGSYWSVSHASYQFH